jgi:arsenate reductase
MTLTLYGIPNCDTVKKARNYLDRRGISYHFHDYKKAGVTAADLERWSDIVGWEKLLNKAGTTFKKLPDADKVDTLFTQALARKATPAEQSAAARYLADLKAAHTENPAMVWADFAQSVLNLKEFLYLK